MFEFDEDERIESEAERPDDEQNIPESASVLETFEDFIREIEGNLKHLKLLWKQDKSLIANILSFLQLLGSEGLNTEFIPLLMFLEAVGRRSADKLDSQAPSVCRITKLFASFGCR